MASRTLQISGTVKDSSTTVVEAGKPTARNYATTNSAVYRDRRSITTAEVTISIPSSIGDAGLCYIENLDATNFLEVGFATGNYPIRIPKGQFAQFWLAPATATLYLKADTAAVEADLVVFER